MNLFYQKLNVSLPVIDYSVFKGNFFFGYKDDDTQLSYYYISDDFKLEIKKIFTGICDLAPCQFRYVEIIGDSTGLRPHKDYGISCSVNYYFHAGNVVTNWYNPKSSAVESISIEDRSRTYQHADIDLVDHYTALDNECYLFNNSAIHSVHGGTGVRKFIQIQFGINYSKLSNLIWGA